MAKRARKAPKKPQRSAASKGKKAKKAATRAKGRAVRKAVKTPKKPVVKRSTGSPAGAGDSRRVPALERERKRLRDVEETVPTPPSSLNLERHGSAARSGRAALEHA